MDAMIAGSNCIIPLSGQAERRIGRGNGEADRVNSRAQISRFRVGWRICRERPLDHGGECTQ
jgi:hypothetical protein